jgi:opacity protein-like surface antigen
MIRLALAVIAVMSMSGSLLLAQNSTPKIEVFGGYSLFNADSGNLTPTTLYNALHEPNGPFAVATNFNGWNAEGQYNINHLLGLVVDGGGRYGSQITQSRLGLATVSGLPKGNGYSLMVGPVLSYRTKSRMTPFAHVLFGFDRISLSASAISGVTFPAVSVGASSTDASLAIGGGLDVRVFRRFSLRAAQLDFDETTHNLNHFYGDAFPAGAFASLATHERNWRVSTGFVVNF